MITNLSLACFVCLILVSFAPLRSVQLSETAQAWSDGQAQVGKPFSSAEPPLVLTDEEGKYPLGLHLEILEDPTGKLTIEDVSSPAFDTKFTPNQAPVPNFGYTTSVYWVRFDLDNQTRQANEWLLEIGYVYTQFVDLYAPSPDGSGFTVKQTGALRPVATRDILFPRILFNLSVPTQSQQTYYLRYQSEGSMTLPLTLWAKDTFWVQSQPKQMQDWLFFGALLALLVYHLFLYFSLRDIRYLFFVILLASMFVHLSTLAGYLQTYIFPGLYQVERYGVWFPALAYASIVLFSAAFWELPTRHPRIHRAHIAVLVGWAVIILLIPLTSYHNAVRLVVPYALVSLLITWVPWVASWRKGYAPSRFFVVAWLGMLVSLFLILLVRLRAVPSTPLTEELYQPGILLMAVGWSMALADRFHLLQAGTENAVLRLQKSERWLAQILDAMPLSIAVYGKDEKPIYANKRAVELFAGSKDGVQNNLESRRTLAEAIEQYPVHIAGSDENYPYDKLPVYRALSGQPASADDLELHIDTRTIPIEMWASPVTDAVGKVEAAVAAFFDITQRRGVETELKEYRIQLESMVNQRTEELDIANRELRLHLEWLEAVNTINQTVANSTDFRQIYEKIIEIAGQVFRTDDAFIAELDPDGSRLKILAHSCQRNDHPALVGSFTTLPAEIPPYQNLAPGELYIVTRKQISAMPGLFGEHIRHSDMQKIVVISLQARDQVLGFLSLELNEAERTMTREENRLLTIFSTDIAQIILNAHLFEQSKIHVAEEERNQLSRQLHDSLSQALFSIQLFTDATRRALKANRIGAVGENLDDLKKLSREAISDLRLLIYQMRPSELEEDGLVTALRSRLRTVESRAGFKVQFEPIGEVVLTVEQENEIYWIAQEILNNILKHAQANEVRVRLEGQAGFFKMMIEDDGVGFEPDNVGGGGGQGLRNIRERAEKIGAACVISSMPGQGTKVHIGIDL